MRPLVVHPEVDPRHVAAAQRHERAARRRSQLAPAAPARASPARRSGCGRSSRACAGSCRPASSRSCRGRRSPSAGAPCGRRSPSRPTVNSRPPMYSSISAGCWYLPTISRTTSRSSASLWQTLLLSTPLQEPSATGFTISGKLGELLVEPLLAGGHQLEVGRVDAAPGGRSSSPAPCRARCESVAGSEPVYGMSSSSQQRGTWLSRFRPLKPSAMLKTMSSGVVASTPGSSGVRLEIDHLVAPAGDRLADRLERRRASRTRPRESSTRRRVGLIALHVVGEAHPQRAGLARRLALAAGASLIL